MAVWSIKTVSNLPHLRLDAEYYQPFYSKLARQLHSVSTVPLGEIAFVTDGIHASPDTVEDDGIQYLSAKCVKDNHFTVDDAIRISKSQDSLNRRTRVQPDDVLLTTVGTIGNAAVVTRDLIPSNIDRHVGLIRLMAGGAFDPFFLSTFLNSKFGRFQTMREATGNVQLNLFIEKIKELKIPILGCADDVAHLTKRSYEKVKEAKRLHDEAEGELIEELGIGRVDISRQLFFDRKFSETRAARRFDAEYFQPKYYRLMRKLAVVSEKKFCASIGELSKPLKYGTSQKLSYQETGVPFLRIADLEKNRFALESVLRISPKEAELQRQARVETGDVLLSRSGTLGLAVPIPQELNNAVYGSYFIRLRPDPRLIDPEYLALYLNAPCGQLQVERLNTGGIQTNLTIPAIKSIIVAVGDLRWQKRFVNKVCASFEAGAEARRLREDAKGLIESTLSKKG